MIIGIGKGDPYTQMTQMKERYWCLAELGMLKSQTGARKIGQNQDVDRETRKAITHALTRSKTERSSHGTRRGKNLRIGPGIWNGPQPDQNSARDNSGGKRGHRVARLGISDYGVPCHGGLRGATDFMVLNDVFDGSERARSISLS